MVLAVATAMWFGGLRGSDYPAQIYRVGVIRRFGAVVWDANWYGGHYLPGYGVVFPAVAAVTGIGLPAVASTVLSVVLVGSLLRHAGLPHVVAGTSVFAYLMLVNLYVGRIPFAVGLMFSLACVRAAVSRRWVLAGGAAVLASLSSPVAAGFLAITLCAWLAPSVHRTGWRGLRSPIAALVLAAVAAPVAIAVAFPEGGTFPFRGAELVLIIVVIAIALTVMPRQLTAVRWGFAASALVAIPLFFVPNPLGGNLVRLALVGAPILAAASLRSRWIQLALVASLLVWQSRPLPMVPRQLHDPSAQPSFHDPLVADGDRRSPTARHASRSRSATTTGRPHTLPTGCRSPAAGNANSTIATTMSSTRTTSTSTSTVSGWTTTR